MPLFEMQCTKCAHVFDDLIKLSDPNPVCTKCGEPTERVIGCPAFQFKNGGVDMGTCMRLAGKAGRKLPKA